MSTGPLAPGPTLALRPTHPTRSTHLTPGGGPALAANDRAHTALPGLTLTHAHSVPTLPCPMQARLRRRWLPTTRRKRCDSWAWAPPTTTSWDSSAWVVPAGTTPADVAGHRSIPPLASPPGNDHSHSLRPQCLSLPQDRSIIFLPHKHYHLPPFCRRTPPADGHTPSATHCRVFDLLAHLLALPTTSTPHFAPPLLTILYPSGT